MSGPIRTYNNLQYHPNGPYTSLQSVVRRSTHYEYNYTLPYRYGKRRSRAVAVPLVSVKYGSIDNVAVMYRGNNEINEIWDPRQSYCN